MAFFIFGARGVERTTDSGTFFCPRCGGTQPYDRKSVRRLGTLFSVTVFPLGTHGEYVECRTCRSTFKPEILDIDPKQAVAEFEAAFFSGVRRVAVHMMCADGATEATEIQTIQRIHRQLTGEDLAEDAIRNEARAIEGAGEPQLLQFLTALSRNLNDYGKEMVVRCALKVAGADSRFESEERVFIFRVGQALGMSRAHVRGVVAESLTSPDDTGELGLRTWH